MTLQSAVVRQLAPAGKSGMRAIGCRLPRPAFFGRFGKPVYQEPEKSIPTT
jgi:hypothetical protein